MAGKEPAGPGLAGWEAWQARVEKIMECFVGMCSLFVQRQISCPLRTLEASLGQMLGAPFDAVTLEVLQAISPGLLSVTPNREDPGATAISLVVYETAKEDEKGEPSKKKAKRTNSFKPQQIKNLPDKLKKLKEEFHAKLRAFRSSREGQGRRPPPLNQQEKAEEDRRRAAEGPSSGSSAEEKGTAWDPRVAVTAANFLDFVQTLPWYEDQVQHREETPARPARTSRVEELGWLSAAVRQALLARGIADLYVHQVKALEALMREEEGAGKDVMITTATASGKSLCYTLPVFQAFARCPASTRALFLFPTKALAQDQLSNLRSLAAACCPSLVLNCLDGDTPRPTRASIRDASHVLLTNPDMLHVTILPQAASDPHWAEWLASLRFVVVDEAHHYRGAFGCHVSLILRRLLRMCLHCSKGESRPSVVLCSATIANPLDHAANLTGLDPQGIVVVDEDGSPQGPRTVALWNPPLIKTDEQQPSSADGGSAGRPAVARRSAYKDVARLLAELVKHGVRTLVFVKVRYIAELVLQLTREHLPDEGLKAKVASYRAGYLADKRRELEQGLSSGRLVAVVSTNALELGVDIGDLNVTLHVGVPSSISSLRQQAGRAGRKGSASLSVVVALDSALDQYLVHHPDALFGRSVEAAVADPSNPVLLADHLRCAAFELPLQPHDVSSIFGQAAVPVVEGLVGEGKLHSVEGPGKGGALKVLDRRKAPAGGINIRSIGSGHYTLINQSSKAVMETLEAQTAFYQVYEGAVYLHQGESFIITSVDLEKKEALLKRQDVPYFTSTRDHTRVSILGQRTQALARLPSGVQAPLCTGPVKVVRQVYGYKVQDKRTTRVTDTVDLHLPPMEYDTMAVWLAELPQELRQRFRAYGPGGKPYYTRFGQAGLHAVEHVLIALAPLEIMCDPQDLSCQHTRRETDLHQDKLLLFETHRGGMGLTQRLAQRLPDLLTAAYKVVSECPCEAGCQSCIFLGSCYEDGPEKAAALEILECLVKNWGA